jgi:glucose/arabinose dehydrogenase
MFKSLLFLVGIIALIFVGISVTKSLEKQGVKPVDTTKINLTGFVPNQKQVPKQQSELDAKINMPDGFSIDYFNNNVNGARSMTKGTNGLIYVGTRSQGKVYAVSESEVVEVATGLNNPNGVAYKDGDLYVAEISRIFIFLSRLLVDL